MPVAFVTTINQKLFDQYGKRFIYEFAEYASEEIKLFIVFEGNYPEELLNIKKNIFVIPFLSEQHQLFIKYFGKLYEANGVRVKTFIENKEQKINQCYCFGNFISTFMYEPTVAFMKDSDPLQYIYL